MQEAKFSIREVLNIGWEEWKKRWGLWIAVVAISALLGSIGNLGTAFYKDSPVQTIFQVLGILVGAYASLGVINIALRTVKHYAIELNDYFNTFQYYGRFLLGQILYYVAVVIGLLLFIVPGIYIAIKYFLFPYFIVEKNMGVIDAFKASGNALHGSKGHLFLFMIVSALINILGIICLGIGLFVTIPVTVIAQAAIYKKLTDQLTLIPES